jgi:hypothetical protein
MLDAKNLLDRMLSGNVWAELDRQGIHDPEPRASHSSFADATGA